MRALAAFLKATWYLFLITHKQRRKPTDVLVDSRRRRATALYVMPAPYDPVLDWTPPSDREIRQTRQFVLQPMKALTSCVFYSTGSDGRVYEGLSQIPSQPVDRPMLFVSNHQLVGLDSWLVVNELLYQCNIFARSLTHPFLYVDDPDGTSFLERNGCLPVSTRNFVRLLQTNQPTLLFPGGAKESFLNQADGAYDMEGWTETTDFVRAAAKHNAIVVPFSSVGAAESALFWDDLPGLKDMAPRVQQVLQTVAGPRAPTDARYNAGTDNRIAFPLVFPKPWPARHYFWFHAPVSLPLDYKDRQACAKTYQAIKDHIQDGCQTLVRTAQEKDPFYEPWRRIPYEQFIGRSAPSFAATFLQRDNRLKST